MNKNLLFVAAFVLLCCAVPVGAQVAVGILDAPPSAYRFEPVWVTFEVRNQGSRRILIPADSCSHQGAFLEVGRTGEPLHDLRSTSDCRNRRLVWLSPGDRWLFFRPVALGPEGTYEIEAALRSPGECQGALVGPERPRVEPVRITELGGWRYDCFEGETRSQRISIEVAVPDSKVDLSAATFLELDHVRWRNNWQNSLRMNVGTLLHRFPTSHYTYAALRAAGSDLSMLNAILLQPDNPLNPWAAGAMAARLAYENRPCAVSKRPRRGTPSDLAERYAKVIAAYPPPEPVSDYLRQLELEYAAEECPEREAGEERRDE